MIKAMLFDMDGTLVQNEKLKALSVALAVQQLRGLPEPDPRGIEAYRDMVGGSREAVSRHIVDLLELEADLRPLMTEYGATETWEVLGTMRRAEKLAGHGIGFLEVGTSGGVWGLAEGYSLMIGGDPENFRRLEPIFQTLAPGEAQGYGHVGLAGPGTS